MVIDIYRRYQKVGLGRGREKIRFKTLADWHVVIDIYGRYHKEGLGREGKGDICFKTLAD